MINKVSIRNFKSLRDVLVDLERFTVFVGPNASGKSSILQGLDMLCQRFRVDHPQTLDAELLACLSRGTDDQIELACESGGKAYRYRSRFNLSSPPSTQPTQTTQAGDERRVADSLVTPDWKPLKPQLPRPNPLPLSVMLRLEPSKLAQPNPAPANPTMMSPDGTGLHSALANMALNDPDSWQALQANLKSIIRTIRRLRHTKSSLQMHQPAALLFDTVGADSLPASQVSEGTLLVLGLLAALHAENRPSLILLDDLDRGLHPKAQQELISLLRGLLGANPDLQLLATTHSPFMLDCMAPNEVRMTSLREDGATVCGPLAAHPEFNRWKEEMAPGEMWSMFGEKWLVGREVAS